VQLKEEPYPKAYDSKRDLFNQERALEKESQLQRIRAPLLSDFPDFAPRRPKPALVDKPDQVDQPESVSDQQRLINDWKRMLDDEKLSQKSIRIKDAEPDVASIAS
jgi:hypothetical protein